MEIAYPAALSLAQMKKVSSTTSSTIKANLGRAAVVEQLRRNLETGRNGEDVHSPHVGVVRNLDRPVIVVRRILLKALDTSHAHPSLVSWFPL